MYLHIMAALHPHPNNLPIRFLSAMSCNCIRDIIPAQNDMCLLYVREAS